MRIKLKHETNYAYGEPAQSALQLLRLTPRSCDNQFVRHWRVEIDADARLQKGEDAYGNLTHMVFIEGPLMHVSIRIEGEVDTADQGGAIRGTFERQSERLFLRETPLTAASAELRKFAQGQYRSEGGDLLATLHRINAELNRRLAFQVGATTSSTTAAAAFAAQTGVCQDFAHVFIAAARSLGVPARYVSGYYLRTDRDDQEAGHAWAEASLPHLGWIGFDPAQGHCVTDRYVRVAIGADGNEAAPVRGARIGGAQERLDVAIQVQQGRRLVEE